MEVSSAKAGLPESHIYRTYTVTNIYIYNINKKKQQQQQKKNEVHISLLYKRENDDREVARLIDGSSEFQVKVAL